MASTENDEIGGLFAKIVPGRPEAVAQGILQYTLETHPCLDKLFRPELESSGGISASGIIVKPEVLRKDGWRVDLRLKWDDGLEKDVELKISAPLTKNQREVLQTMDFLVVPSTKEWRWKTLVENAGGSSPRVVTWKQIAEVLPAQSVLRKLLLEADAHADSWVLETIEAEDVIQDLLADEGKVGTKSLRWLSTLHLQLEWYPGYRPSPAWANSMREGYCGHCFGLEPEHDERPYWIGFTHSEGKTPELQLWWNNQHLLESIKVEGSLTIDSAYERICAELDKHRTGSGDETKLA